MDDSRGESRRFRRLSTEIPEPRSHESAPGGGTERPRPGLPKGHDSLACARSGAAARGDPMRSGGPELC